MPLHRKPKRLPGDHRLLRQNYESQLAARWLKADTYLPNEPDLHSDYVEWLRSKGIDPNTGRMTVDGLAFFEQLVAADNDRIRRRRHAA